jgi:pseudouridine-5'-phosphate glycosidase
MFAHSYYHPLVIHLGQETLGVPVVTYGETHDFPAFYTPSSGYKVGFRFACVHNALIFFFRIQSPWRVNDPVSAANILCMWSMNSFCGISKDFGPKLPSGA